MPVGLRADDVIESGDDDLPMGDGMREEPVGGPPPRDDGERLLAAGGSDEPGRDKADVPSVPRFFVGSEAARPA